MNHPQWWLDYLKLHLRPDFDTGLLYWKIPGRGRRVGEPIGCLDQNGYVKISVSRRVDYAHRIIWFLYHGEWPTALLDHDDRNRSNNRPGNLLLSNHSANAMNSGVWASNTTGVRGVSFCSQMHKFKVTKQGKHLGYYRTLEEAAAAYGKDI